MNVKKKTIFISQISFKKKNNFFFANLNDEAGVASHAKVLKNIFCGFCMVESLITINTGFREIYKHFPMASVLAIRPDKIHPT